MNEHDDVRALVLSEGCDLDEPGRARLRTALEIAAHAVETGQAPPAPRIHRVSPSARRPHRRGWVAGTAAALVLIVGAFVWSQARTQPDQTPSTTPPSAPSTTVATQPVTIGDVAGATWAILPGQGGWSTAPQQPSITIRRDGSFSGYDGCASVTGRFTESDGALRLDRWDPARLCPGAVRAPGPILRSLDADHLVGSNGLHTLARLDSAGQRAGVDDVVATWRLGPAIDDDATTLAMRADGTLTLATARAEARGTWQLADEGLTIELDPKQLDVLVEHGDPAVRLDLLQRDWATGPLQAYVIEPGHLLFSRPDGVTWQLRSRQSAADEIEIDLGLAAGLPWLSVGGFGWAFNTADGIGLETDGVDAYGPQGFGVDAAGITYVMDAVNGRVQVVTETTNVTVPLPEQIAGLQVVDFQVAPDGTQYLVFPGGAAAFRGEELIGRAHIEGIGTDGQTESFSADEHGLWVETGRGWELVLRPDGSVATPGTTSSADSEPGRSAAEAVAADVADDGTLILDERIHVRAQPPLRAPLLHTRIADDVLVVTEMVDRSIVLLLIHPDGTYAGGIAVLDEPPDTPLATVAHVAGGVVYVQIVDSNIDGSMIVSFPLTELMEHG